MDCIGLVRFSVLSTVYNKFKAWEGKSFEEYAATILAESRLRSRFQLFEHITLPSFDCQTDKNFLLLVIAPRLLPAHWRSKLDALATKRPYMRIHYADESEFRLSHLAPLILGMMDREIFSTFRIDDDDGVADTFVERLRQCHKPHFVNFGVSFSKGYYVDLSPGSTNVRLKPRDSKNTSVGLAFISSKKKSKTIFEISEGHRNFHTKRPVILDGRKTSFVLLNHEWNDTEDKRHGGGEELSPEVAEQVLHKEGVHIDLVGLMRERENALATSPFRGCGAAFSGYLRS